ncbi:CLUMA_CG003936, isoform A [Clunio marinus]|uniref:CLUMA_CG003936, isoform A n=1 Tax=Clunio marinus TaxID=568069 RepID=A0A1J1HQA1_9DIPT|nr:CLUMA_CG003936, isoform A [Clunio marinus]
MKTEGKILSFKLISSDLTLQFPGITLIKNKEKQISSLISTQSWSHVNKNRKSDQNLKSCIQTFGDQPGMPQNLWF